MKPVAVYIPEMGLVEKDDLEDGSSDKFGQTAYFDAAQVKNNDSKEISDARTYNNITLKVFGTPEIAQVETKLEDMKPVAVESPNTVLVEKAVMRQRQLKGKIIKE